MHYIVILNLGIHKTFKPQSFNLHNFNSSEIVTILICELDKHINKIYMFVILMSGLRGQ